MKENNEAAVLLIAFNRPDNLKQVFKVVRQVKPSKLYLSVDGPRENKKEENLCQECRDIIKQVDWPCETHTLFRSENRGCGYGPAEAISWAFETEDRLIILEDDCIPSQSFFRFCNEMLERYKDDERINIISGRSHHEGSKYFKSQDYIFTHYAHTWGWATWKRCWIHFDIKMSDFTDFLEIGGAINVLSSSKEGKYFNHYLQRIFKQIEEECSHSWDSQWLYTRIKLGSLGIVPAHNLIHNIGAIGTHSNGHNECYDLQASEMPLLIRHPLFMNVNKEYEIHHFNTIIHKKESLLNRILDKAKKMIVDGK